MLACSVERFPERTPKDLRWRHKILLGYLVSSLKKELPCPVDGLQKSYFGALVNTMFLAQGAHTRSQFAQVMAGNAWEEMVDVLELQSSMEPVHPPRVHDGEGGAELSPNPAILDTLRVIVLGSPVDFHTKVAECDLQVEQTGHRVGHEHVHEHLEARG